MKGWRFEEAVGAAAATAQAAVREEWHAHADGDEHVIAVELEQTGRRIGPRISCSIENLLERRLDGAAPERPSLRLGVLLALDCMADPRAALKRSRADVLRADA